MPQTEKNKYFKIPPELLLQTVKVADEATSKK